MCAPTAPMQPLYTQPQLGVCDAAPTDHIYRYPCPPQPPTYAMQLPLHTNATQLGLCTNVPSMPTSAHYATATQPVVQYGAYPAALPSQQLDAHHPSASSLERAPCTMQPSSYSMQQCLATAAAQPALRPMQPCAIAVQRSSFASHPNSHAIQQSFQTSLGSGQLQPGSYHTAPTQPPPYAVQHRAYIVPASSHVGQCGPYANQPGYCVSHLQPGDDSVYDRDLPASWGTQPNSPRWGAGPFAEQPNAVQPPSNGALYAPAGKLCANNTHVQHAPARAVAVSAVAPPPACRWLQGAPQYQAADVDLGHDHVCAARMQQQHPLEDHGRVRQCASGMWPHPAHGSIVAR